MSKDEQYNQKLFFFWSKGFWLASLAFRYAFFIWLAYIALDAIEALAGKETIAAFIMKFAASEKTSSTLPWIVSACFGIWAALERFFRKSKTESMQQRIRNLESMIDPGRTSSGLLPSGDSRPEDRTL